MAEVSTEVVTSFILCLIPGCRHLRHTPRRSIHFHYALIAVLGRALSTSPYRFSAIRCESTFLFPVVHLGVHSGSRLPLVSFLGFRLTTFPGGIQYVNVLSEEWRVLSTRGLSEFYHRVIADFVAAST